MRSKRAIVLMTISTILLLGLFVDLFLAPALFPHLGAKRSATIFFRNLTNGDFDRASEYVLLLADFGPEPTISDEDAKKVWVSRMTRLKQKGIYIKSYRNLKTFMFKGSPAGEVVIIAVKNGQEFSSDSTIDFSQADGRWRVRCITMYKQDIPDLSRALRENITYDEYKSLRHK